MVPAGKLANQEFGAESPNHHDSSSFDCKGGLFCLGMAGFPA
jgi:hypothetical protein